MMAGHTMLKVFGGFVISLGLLGGWLPLSFSVALTGLEILVAFLQACRNATSISKPVNATEKLSGNHPPNNPKLITNPPKTFNIV